MRLSTSHAAALAVLFFSTAILSQNTNGLNGCARGCGNFVSSCRINGEDAMCACFTEAARPHKEGADCLRGCAENAGLDPAALYAEACDPIFEDEDEDRASSGDGKASASQTGSDSPSKTDGDDGNGDERDAAVAHRVPTIVITGGLVAALLL